MVTGLIFFSWQDEHPPHVGRSFVRSLISEGLGFADHVVLDASRDGHDATRISRSAACVVDLTSVAPQTNGNIPNPDGLIDLGSALDSLGCERIVCVVNTYFGFSNLALNSTSSTGHLVLFELHPYCDFKARRKVRHRVVSELSYALRLVLNKSSSAKRS